MNQAAEAVLYAYREKAPFIAPQMDQIRVCVKRLTTCFVSGGQLLICGNGGSCADADHIAGELVKAFRIKRPIEALLERELEKQGIDGAQLAGKLQGGVPVINFGAHSALITAMLNDVGGEYIYAQQVVAYGRSGDILLGISTSGNAKDVLYAGITARAKGIYTIGLTGKTGGRMAKEFDLMIQAETDTTEDIQDVHSTIYHAICAAVECELWGK